MRTLPLLLASALLYGCLLADSLSLNSLLPRRITDGVDNCPKGPTYWCQDISTSSECRATQHCIQTVWLYQKLPRDDSSVCQICLDMVKQARDQLLSNETQEELKEVFEGSCNLIPIKIVSKECDRVVDEFLPELVDTLASQMQPQVVCSVAGLCNNDRIDAIIRNTKAVHQIEKKAKNRCDGCHTVMDIVEQKFRAATHNQILQAILSACGELGSLSDSCSAIVIRYFYDIYNFLDNNLNSNDFCLMAGECSAMFHTHANVAVIPLSKVGVVPVVNDDLPCDLCKQLVQHLRDILIANTTESEFRQVLLGICKQTASFQDECTQLVQQYYSLVYGYLTNDLNGTVVCGMVQICPGPALFDISNNPIQPLVPVETAKDFESRLASQKQNSLEITGSSEAIQLPIERVMPQTLTIIGNTELCEFCEYFLHFVQNALTDPKTELKIRNVVDKACDLLPRSVNETCQEFVNTYGPAFIAILAQDIDPSLVCPKLSLCPSKDAPNVEIFMGHKVQNKPKCPMCLLAVTSLEEYVKNEKTEANIRKGLSVLCSHLKTNLKEECDDFVQTYTNEIVEACLADLKPAEVCEYLKLCKDTLPAPGSKQTSNQDTAQLVRIPLQQSEIVSKKFEKKYMPIEYGGHVATNEIPDYTANGQVIQERVESSVCVLCEFVMTQLRQQLQDNATEDEIKTAVHNICHHLPKSVKSECDAFVDEYADAVIEMLIQSLDPNQICAELKLCKPSKIGTESNNDLVDLKSPQCYLCKVVLAQIEKTLKGQITEDEVIKAVKGACKLLPAHQMQECDDFIAKNGKTIIELLQLAIQPSEVCSIILLCQDKFDDVKRDVYRCGVCLEMTSNMENLLKNPKVRSGKNHILEKTCRGLPANDQDTCKNLVVQYGNKIFAQLAKGVPVNSICSQFDLCGKQPRSPELLGREKCTWGPSYWCTDRDTASTCGAIKHCEEKVWKSLEKQ